MTSSKEPIYQTVTLTRDEMRLICKAMHTQMCADTERRNGASSRQLPPAKEASITAHYERNIKAADDLHFKIAGLLS